MGSDRGRGRFLGPCLGVSIGILRCAFARSHDLDTMRAREGDELCVAGVYGAEGGGAHDKTRAVDEELFGAGYGFIPDRLEGALGHAFRRQVTRELAVDVPFV